MGILVCPVCKRPLSFDATGACCRKKHRFDMAKEGYVNLLLSNKPGASGDNRDMSRARSVFLSKGYYGVLAEALYGLISGGKSADVLDICCGEGYYTSYLGSRLPYSFYGFDLSKDMVRLAAKRKSGVCFFTANLADIPVADASVDIALHLFAPFASAEFARVMKKNGVLLSVIPGKNHLMGLKTVLYDSPYQNDEMSEQAQDFTLANSVRVASEITVDGSDDIKALLMMTPYYYKTPREGLERLSKLDSLKTEIEFIINVYRVST